MQVKAQWSGSSDDGAAQLVATAPAAAEAAHLHRAGAADSPGNGCAQPVAAAPRASARDAGFLQDFSDARIEELFGQTNEQLWPPPLAAAAAISPAEAAATAARKPLSEVLRAAFDEVVMPATVVARRRLRQQPAGLWSPDEWWPVDSETWRMREYGAADHIVQQ